MRARIFLIVTLTMMFHACRQYSNELDYRIIPVKVHTQWGYVNRDAKLVIDTLFTDATLFSEGVACVSKDNKYGYIRDNGKFLIDPTFKNASIFSEDMACVVLENQYPSYINKSGEIKLNIQNAEMAGIFKEGLAPVFIKGKWGFIDKNGQVVIKPQFEGVSYFKDGLSIIIQNFQNKKMNGFMNKQGEIVIKPLYEAAYPFSEGLALVKQDTIWSFIDASGTTVLKMEYKTVFPFSEGLSLVKKDSLFGYIDKTGKFAIQPQFLDAESFRNGLAMFMNSDSLYGYINSKGVIEIAPKFKNAGYFNQGISYFKEKDKYGFINAKGKTIVSPQYDEVFGSKSYNSVVESDFFNIGELMSIFMKNTSSTSIRKVSKETTLKDLVDDIHTGSNITVPNDTTIHIDEPIIIDEHSEISELDYFFSEKIYKEYYSYGESKRKYQLDTKVNGMEYTLNLTDRASSKYQSVEKALMEKFSELTGSKSIQTNGISTFENSSMRITIGIEKKDKENLKIKVKLK
jgi:hypothetical protein